MEKIKNISITNFKSIKHLEINDCKKINVFIGMPNAGKSNILEALGLYGILDFVSGSLKLIDFVRFNEPEELFFEGEVLKKSVVSLNDQQLNVSYDDKSLSLKCSTSNVNFYFGDGGVSTANTFNSFKNHNNIRKYEFLKYNDINKNSNIDNVLNFPFGENIAKILGSIPKLRQSVSSFFKLNNLNLILEKNSNTLRIYKEIKDGVIFSLPYNLIADTLQRLIFYKAAIMSNQNSVLLFEEPEAHCFEPYILEFTNAVKYDENNNQFFIVTHSEFILQEFLRDEESKNNTNIYLVNNIDGETKVKLLAKDNNDDVYEFGMNPFFNFENLWENN